ncbi:hypothetical protein [Streptomyces sp. NPDC050560]|uniref:hypothetical protein n=1 Tax=Streptomyces sp. NPDC050560 TaxID=3365630 RepID=UPI00378794EC
MNMAGNGSGTGSGSGPGKEGGNGSGTRSGSGPGKEGGNGCGAGGVGGSGADAALATPGAPALIRYEIKPSAFAAVFHRLLTRPVVEIDGTEHESAWGAGEVSVPPGEHRVGVYFRYRGQRTARLGASEAAFAAGPGARMLLSARLGAANGSVFRLSLSGSATG